MGKNTSEEKGQTLIEILVAMSAAIVILTAISVTISSSLNNANYSKNQTLATKYAQEGMEIVRQIRDSNYVVFANYNGTYCLAKGQYAFGGSCSSPNVDNFIRIVQIQPAVVPCGANTALVSVVVSWTDGKCRRGVYCNKVQQDSCLSTVSPM